MNNCLDVHLGQIVCDKDGVVDWCRFKEGRESVRDDERYGGSKEVNTPILVGQMVRVRITMLRF